MTDPLAGPLRHLLDHATRASALTADSAEQDVTDRAAAAGAGHGKGGVRG